MDQRKFDRLTQRVSAAESRRQALRALLGAALVGTTTKNAAATKRRAPRGRGERCKDGTTCHGDACCGEECCPGRCFVDADNRPFCCTAPDWVICGNSEAANREERQICCPKAGSDPCSCVGPTVITGSYRRR